MSSNGSKTDFALSLYIVQTLRVMTHEHKHSYADIVAKHKTTQPKTVTPLPETKLQNIAPPTRQPQPTLSADVPTSAHSAFCVAFGCNSRRSEKKVHFHKDRSTCPSHTCRKCKGLVQPDADFFFLRKEFQSLCANCRAAHKCETCGGPACLIKSKFFDARYCWDHQRQKCGAKDCSTIVVTPLWHTEVHPDYGFPFDEGEVELEPVYCSKHCCGAKIGEVVTHSTEPEHITGLCRRRKYDIEGARSGEFCRENVSACKTHTNLCQSNYCYKENEFKDGTRSCKEHRCKFVDPLTQQPCTDVVYNTVYSSGLYCPNHSCQPDCHSKAPRTDPYYELCEPCHRWSEDPRALLGPRFYYKGPPTGVPYTSETMRGGKCEGLPPYTVREWKPEHLVYRQCTVPDCGVSVWKDKEGKLTLACAEHVCLACQYRPTLHMSEHGRRLCSTCREAKCAFEGCTRSVGDHLPHRFWNTAPEGWDPPDMTYASFEDQRRMESLRELDALRFKYCSEHQPHPCYDSRCKEIIYAPLTFIHDPKHGEFDDRDDYYRVALGCPKHRCKATPKDSPCLHAPIPETQMCLHHTTKACTYGWSMVGFFYEPLSRWNQCTEKSASVSSLCDKHRCLGIRTEPSCIGQRCLNPIEKGQLCHQHLPKKG